MLSALVIFLVAFAFVGGFQHLMDGTFVGSPPFWCVLAGAGLYFGALACGRFLKRKPTP